ncbi:MAG: ubiquinone/menaquinone biosynthesis methyltransferase [Armatimonadetes bacterium]|nr:ubiquinone/menaquinone biosynthesis methyltransferase [Armatimonadota bacterium]
MAARSDDTTNAHRRAVTAMFDRIAARYDFLNDILSFGLHRIARRFFMKEIKLRPGQLVLDVCSGTGALSRRARARGAVVVELDASEVMLRHRKSMLTRRPDVTEDASAAGWAVVADAMALPFADSVFDAAMVGFAVRDVASPQQLFAEMGRVVKSGGNVGCIEFTQPPRTVSWLLRPYLRRVVPTVGGLVDRAAYSFLAESVTRVMSAEELADIMETAGLKVNTVKFCVGGIVAIHVATAP